LKCLYQDRKVNGYVFVCQGYRVCLFLRFSIGFLNCSDSTKYKLSIKKRRREKCENQWYTVETDPTSNRKLAIANTLLHDLSLSFLATGISIKSVLWNLLISSNFLKGYILKRLLKDINSLKSEILLMIKHLYSDIVCNC
jgi:hypothetical protein